MKIKSYRRAHTVFERSFPSGLYIVTLYIGSELADKVRCDDYRMALDYLRAFNSIAKNA